MRDENTYSYEEARAYIANGDVIFFTGYPTLFAFFIRLLTRSEWYHVGIAFWLEMEGTRRLMILEANRKGRSIVPMSKYRGKKMMVCKTQTTWPQMLSGGAIDKVAGVEYGWLDIISLFVFEVILKKRPPDFPGEVCSEMVAKLLRRGGIPLTTMQSPGKLFKELARLNAIKTRLFISPKE